MLFLLIPLILNPISFTIVRWLPALYLAAWPIIIQTLGREALIVHAVVLILFIITCDITRKTMLKLIGFDLISLPAGIAILAILMSEKGASVLSLILPLFSWAITITEPIFILLETLVIMEIIKSLNKWISQLSNQRDESSQNLSSWEPPLTRTAIMTRLLVILLTIACYMGAYVIVQESKSLLQNELGMKEHEIPVQFNYAIAALVTLQLIAFTATIYKESGILSETAMVTIVASVPIFIAAWSFYHLKIEAEASSTWTSYFPFSLFADNGSQKATSGGSDLDHLSLGGGANENRGFFSSTGDDYDEQHFGQRDQAADFRLDFRAFQRALDASSPSDGMLKYTILTVVRHFTKLINSILGSSLDRLAKYYFGPDFWLILAARLGCLLWWLLLGFDKAAGAKNVASEQQRNGASNGDSGELAQGLNSVARLRLWVPLSQTTLVKILIISAYAQMLVQQMENKDNLHSGQWDKSTIQLEASQHCGAVNQAADCTSGALTQSGTGGPLDSVLQWFSCVWSSARACSSSNAHSTAEAPGSKAERLFDLCTTALAWAAGALLALINQAYQRLASLHTLGYSVYALWLTKWRSPIVLRLMQSMLVQAHYIGSLLLSNDDERADDYL